MTRSFSLATATLACVLAASAATAAFASVEDGDAAWDARAERLVGDVAAPDRIREAIRKYRATLARDPGSLEARWKLLRAHHYAIDFTNLADPAKDRLLNDAVALADEALTRLDGAAEGDRARALFWSAIVWGTRAQRVGLLTIVREGVANRIRDDAEGALALDPKVDDGGPLRLLARLHAVLPSVPFISGWVDRDKALPYAERGYALAPEHPGNRLILGLTLLERAPKRRGEARQLLESVASAEPRAAFLAEDLSIRQQARERLAQLDAAS